MSSVIYKPFGSDKPYSSRMGQASVIAFQVDVNAETIHELADFLEFIYATKIKVRWLSENYRLSFTTTPKRTAAGIRFAVALYKAELISVDEWF